MDSTQFGESAYINPQLVKESISKKLYISGDAKIVEGKYGDKMELPVELDNKDKTWGLSRDIVKSLQAFGKDTKTWVGKWVKLTAVKVGDKEQIIAEPIITSAEQVQ